MFDEHRQPASNVQHAATSIQHPAPSTPHPSSALARAFCLAIFVSAFLLFQVQPLISKVVLPWFGGSPAVWTTAMLFFQVLLFLGYTYAHVTSRYLNPRGQAVVHLVVVLGAVAVLPILPDESWKPAPGVDPTLRMLVLLLVTVGAPFFVLSTSAPLIQVWWSRTGGGSPYRLYALSNAGSLLALISYPFLVAPLVGVRWQAYTWSAVFALWALLLLLCCALALKSRSPAGEAAQRRPHSRPPPDDESAHSISISRRAAWLLLSALGSMLLLSITNYLCQDVAVVPFLWVAPLALYLLSFILCFARSAWYHRGWFCALMMTSMYFAAVIYRMHYSPNFALTSAVMLTALFSGCMVCHGELVRRQPDPAHLTSFYLHLSAGGALGGLFVCVIAPYLFVDYYEYPLTLIACWLVALGILYVDSTSALHRGKRRLVWMVILLMATGFVGLLSEGTVKRHRNVIFSRRNFYGTLKVVNEAAHDPDRHCLSLFHGVIRHGSQLLAEDRKVRPTTYYTEASGIGKVLQHLEDRPVRHIGAVGLGVGTLGAYARDGDRFRFYEIDPDVVLFATQLFTFLEHIQQSGGEYDVILGDARLALEDDDQEFDVIVLDAFSGDAVPVHLLTRQAFAVYLLRLKPDGILAVHISNRHLDLMPVMQGAARQHGLQLARVHEVDPERGTTLSDWALLARGDVLQDLVASGAAELPVASGEAAFWTDDYSNIISLLK